MKKILFGSLFSLILIFSFSSLVKAQDNSLTPQEEFEKAEVLSIDKQGVLDSDGIKIKFQNLTLKIISGSDTNKIIKLQNGGQTFITDAGLVKSGEILILDKVSNNFLIIDKYRLNYIPYLLIGFVLLLIIVAGWKGLGSILGLIISLAIILDFIIPQIINGANPLLIAITGSSVILLVSTYLAHGISKQT